MLAEQFSPERLADVLLPREHYHPFPTADERDGWAKVPAPLRQQLIAEGEKYLGFQWPMLPATLYLEFARVGNRSRFEKQYYARRYALGAMVIAECLEGQGRFIDDIVNGIWCICEETSWCVSAHSNMSQDAEHHELPNVAEPLVDLFAAETAALLSWTYYMLQPQLDTVTPLVSQRIAHELEWRTIRPYLGTNTFWWTGFNGNFVNNWNPWCNSNCLATCLLMITDPQRRAQAVATALRSLDCFIATYHDDGGCDEGTGYWGAAGAALFDCLEQLYAASGGVVSFYEEPLIGEIGRYIARMHISKKYFVNFADGGARHCSVPDLIYRYGKRIGDARLSGLGAELYRLAGSPLPQAPWYSMLRRLPEIFDADEITQATAQPPYYRDVWLPDLQVMVAREQEGTDRGFFLAAKGGTNAESHNHNDVGSCVLYHDGQPVLIDIGVETYSAKTFSAQRYEIWTMQSAYHNLPTVNEVQQHDGVEFRATDVTYCADDDHAEFSLNIAQAYPPEAGIARWQRSYRLVRGEQATVEIGDEYTLTAPTQELMLSLMTPCTPEFREGGIILLEKVAGGCLQLQFDAARFAITAEKIEITDANLAPGWGDHLYRLV
ncbi:MAG TPA: heparinase II/III family protein, partial [Armatimonadota bacterium]|nr:heparinase II/III family protein [Armatimonadota bacterium]